MKAMMAKVAKTLGINVTIKDPKAQLLISAAIFILALGIAWSFIKGWSTITVKTDLKKHTEHIEKKDDSSPIKLEIPTK